ncbi:hypothetical protein DBR45_30125 [Pseudomonas sp. HMWF031]|nr:hypothetical protein DBR45_30125 [Pseudomonas sp. HMWF031]
MFEIVEHRLNTSDFCVGHQWWRDWAGLQTQACDQCSAAQGAEGDLHEPLGLGIVIDPVLNGRC